MDLAGLRVPSIVTGAYGSDIAGTANHLVPVQRNPIRFHKVIGMQYESPFDVSRQARETGIGCRPFARIAQIRANLQRNCVLLPAYNASSTIAQTLDALQNNPGLKHIKAVIVLDDAS
jgi:hypothetical protein